MVELPYRCSLDIAFKGKRGYIQGPDIYNYINNEIKRVAGAEAYVRSIAFKGFISKQVEMILGSSDQQNDSDARGAFAVKIDGNIVKGVIKQSGFTTVGNDVWIGPSATIGNLLTIGDKARIETGSVVVKSVAAGERVSGNFAWNHRANIRDYSMKVRGR